MERPNLNQPLSLSTILGFKFLISTFYLIIGQLLPLEFDIASKDSVLLELLIVPCFWFGRLGIVVEVLIIDLIVIIDIVLSSFKLLQ